MAKGVKIRIVNKPPKGIFARAGESISDTTREALYGRAEGQCECRMKVCKDHSGRCTRDLLKGKWDAHRVTQGGAYELSNLIAMCKPSHENTRSYGRQKGSKRN